MSLGPRPDRRLLLRTASVGLVAGAAAACARIPTESQTSSRPLAPQEQPGAPYVRALPPADDATPAEVVAGFVQAGVGSEDDYAVARAYLTDQAQAAWNPGAGITVYSGSEETRVQDDGDGAFSLVLRVTALIDERGVRSLLPAPATREIAVQVVEQDGQHRLDEVPDGIFLSEAAFETLYASARLYFLDARRRHLVPDLRWFALRQIAADVLRGLADGPSPTLADAVINQIPASTSMGAAAISTGADGTVQVAVPPAITSLSTVSRYQALSQIEASLRSVRTLSGVRLVQEETELMLEEEHRMERALPGHRPIAAGERGIISLSSPSGDAPPTQLVPALAETAVADPIIAQDGVLAAALEPQRAVVLIASTDDSIEVREAATGDAFVPPSIDDAGWVWTATVSNAGALLALSGRASEEDAKVDATWLHGRSVTCLALAADATRMLVLSSDDGQARLDVCAVVRNADGVPTSLGEPTPIHTELTDLSWAGWYDELAVLVLGTDATSGTQRALVVDLVTGADPLPALPDGVRRVAGSVIAETAWVGIRGDQLLRSDGENWSAVDITGRDPAFY